MNLDIPSFSISISTEIVLAIIGIVFTLVAIGISCLIYTIQDKQVLSLTNITKALGDQMVTLTSIASTLRANAITKDNIEAFFPRNTKIKEKYKLFFPGDGGRKTLPSINAGDSYGMYIISSLLGADLNLRALPRNATAGSLKSDELNCNAILLCDVNIALRHRFDFVTLSDIKHSREPNSDPDKLPCWFATYDTKEDYSTSYVINIYDTKNKKYEVLCSPSEEYIIETHNEKHPSDYIKPENLSQFMVDYGIIARLSKENYQYIVVAGLHGYGTMITAHYLNDLMNGKKNNIDKKYKDVFFSDNDFISVIEGDLDTVNMYVDKSDILRGLMWVKNDTDWELC